MVDIGTNFQDGVVIDGNKLPIFHQKMSEQLKPQDQRTVLKPAQSIQCMSEATEWLFDRVDELQLQDKDILLVIGPSRAGKGTLLTSLQGVEMKFFKKNDPKVKDTDVGKQASTQFFLAPKSSADSDKPDDSAIISHLHNSHTFKPKIVSNGQYKENFKDLNGTYLVDFPGMFDSKGYDLDIAMHLALQRLITQAKTAKVLVLAQATCLIAENNHIITTIIDKLSQMFKDPMEHLVIGITKNRMVSLQFEYDEVIDVALGANDEQVSFKGFEVIQIEQDDVFTLKNMITQLNAKGCVKNYVKRGFLDPYEVIKMFEQVKPDKEMEGVEESQWIERLNLIFMSRVPQIDTNLELILGQLIEANKSKDLSDDSMEQMTQGLDKMIQYQNKMKAQWASIQNPKTFKSILGVLPEYRFVNQILDNKRYNNPALNNGLYQIDLQSVDKLKKTLLSVQRYSLKNHTKLRIQALAKKNLIHRTTQAQLLRRCNETIQMLEEELEKMGYDLENQKGQYDTFIKVLKSPIIFVNFASSGLIGLFVKLQQKSAESRQSEQQKQFKLKVSQALTTFLSIDIDIAENCMNVTMTRHTNLRNIIENQKKISEMTYGEPLQAEPSADENGQTYLQEQYEKEIFGVGKPSANIFKQDEMDQVSLNDFKILSVIGQGSFGKVFLVQLKKNKKIYAMKTLRKDVIMDYNKVQSTLLEKEVLKNVNHPFLVGLEYIFQNELRIFFVLNFVRGGELFTHLSKEGCFQEQQARFYAVQVAVALGHLHENQIIYRDLKPENIMINEDGYLKLTDFGISKKIEVNEITNSFCGTPEYISPEMLAEKGHSFPVDWWTLGILTYEMVIGFPPFYVENDSPTHKEMYKMIENNDVDFIAAQYHRDPIKLSPECKDFIKKLLNKDQAKRLGTAGDWKEVVEHPWLKDIKIDDLIAKKIPPIFKPQLSSDPTDIINFDKDFTEQEVAFSIVPQENQRLINIKKNLFEDFDS